MWVDPDAYDMNSIPGRSSIPSDGIHASDAHSNDENRRSQNVKILKARLEMSIG